MAAAGKNKVIIWEVPSGKIICQLETQEGPPSTQPPVSCLAFSPNGATLAVGCYDLAVRLFDVKTGKAAGTFEGHRSAILGLAYSRDGRMVATGSFDGTARTWEASSGKPIDVFAGHKSPVQAVCFAADGRSLYSAGVDTSILHWDVTGISKDNVLPPLNMNKEELENTWDKLAREDVGQAYRAVWEMTASAKESSPFLAGQLYLVDPKHLDQLFADLNNDRFEIRDKASFEIAQKGIWMKGRLLDAVKDPASDEVRLRVEQLLDKVNDPKVPLDQERLRVRRVIMALEQIGDPAATGVLQKIARGAPERFLQDEAQTALDRLAKADK